MLELPEPAVVELEVDVCEVELPVPDVEEEPDVDACALEEPELLEPVVDVEPWLPDAVVLLLEVVEVCVPDDPELVVADVDVELCEPVDPELFDEPVCVVVEPELP